MTNVLIVEDSPTARMLLQRILDSDALLNVVAAVDSGEAALDYLSSFNRPPVHVITMDIVMPGLDGFTATQRIMETTPLPIVIVSAAYKPDEAELSFKAINAGAVAIVEKPVSPSHPDYPRVSAKMVETLRLMSEVKVITRFPRNRQRETAPASYAPAGSKPYSQRAADLVVIGSSTGGPPAVHTILSRLSPGLTVPLLIVQHISRGFVEGLARWLEKGAGLPVHIPADGDLCRPGHVYLAPDDCHMGICTGDRICLEKSQPEYGQRPSVAHLFRSAARHYPKNSIGILLSGMGNDGAAELKLMKDAGAITIAQDEESCVVYGMPWEAVKIDGATYVLPPELIAQKIKYITGGVM
jgi:two-component system chemotaxis response regulator CheB